MTEMTDNFLQLFCVFVCGCVSFFSAITKRSYKWLLMLLFYLSYGMGLVYWVLYLVLFGTSPLVFCISELSWTASYIFLAMCLAADIPKEKQTGKINIVFWSLPAFSIIMGILFCTRGSYFENVLMGVSMSVLGFYAAKGLYVNGRGNRNGRNGVFTAVLLFYAAEYLLWTCSYFTAENGLTNLYYMIDTFILNPALITIAAAQIREDKLCRTT